MASVDDTKIPPFTTVPMNQVRVGDHIICRGSYQQVCAIRAYQTGEPRWFPVRVNLPAIELITAEGSRFGSATRPIHIYRINDRD